MKDQTNQNLLRKYILTNLRILLVVHQKSLRIYSMLKYIFLFLGQLQSSFFYLFPCYLSSLKMFNKFILIYLIRPDLLLIDNVMIDIENKYLFIIPLLSIIVFDVLILQGQVLIEYQNKKLSQNQHQQIIIKSSIQKLIINLKSLYSQLFIVYLYIPAQVLPFTSFAYSDAMEDFEILILSIITVISNIFFQLLKLNVSNTTMDLCITGYERLHFTKIDFLREIVILIQVILYGIIEDVGRAQIAQGLLSILVSLSYIINIFADKTIVVESYIKLTLVTQICLLSLISTSLLDFWQLGLLLIPILIFVGFSYRNQDIFRLTTSISEIKCISKIIQYISYQINNHSNHNSTIDQISHSILLNFHRRKCNDAGCYCNLISDKTDEPLKVLYVSDLIQKKFVISKIKQWNKELKKKRSDHSDQHWIYYISTLNHYGLTSLAFQECNRLLSLQNSMNRGFTYQNEINSSSQNHQQQSLPSQQSGSQLPRKTQAKLSMNSLELKSNLKLSIRNQTLTLLSQMKLELISKDIRLELQNNFLKIQSKQQEETAEAIQLYLFSEQQNQAVKHQVLRCLQQKLQFYNFIINNKSQRSHELFRNAKILSNSFLKLEKKLLQQYSQFPSQKIQSINCFFQSELLNNYLTAYKLANFSTIADEKLLNMRKNIKINLFGKNVVYMLMNLNEGMQTMNIYQFSNNAYDFLQISYEECMKVYKTIDNLLPQAMLNEHHLLVQRFIIQGTSKYFRNISLSFIQQLNGLVKPFNLIVDIIMNQTNNLSFVAFFEEVSITNCYILVDVNDQCGGITQNLLEKLGWKQNEIKQYSEQINHAFQVNINQIIPNFNELKLSQKEQKFYNTPINLLTKKSITTFQQKSLVFAHDSWKNMGNLISLSGTIILQPRELCGYYYYIIEIEDIRLSQTLSQMGTQGKAFTIQLNEVENTNNDIEVSDLVVSGSEAGINKPQSLNIFALSSSVSEQDQENAFSHQQLQAILHGQEIQQDRGTTASKLIQQNPNYQYQEYNLEDAKNNEKQNLGDVNPNQSIRKLMDTSKSFAQQRFFNLEIQDLDQSNSKISDAIQNQMKDVNQMYDVDLNKIDKEMRENIRLQLQLELDQKNQANQQMDDAASQVSSLIGLKKSLFYKKYELINRLMESNLRPSSYRYCNLLLFLSQIIVIIFCLIILTNLNDDFNRFIQEVDMLLFSYSFMTPFDIFLSLRFATVYYSFGTFVGEIKPSENIQFGNWLASHLGEGYDVMKGNFLEQFSNPYILEFFTDENFDVLFMKKNSSDMEQKTISFRESLNVLLQYQYQFKIAYEQKTSLVSQAFSAYPYANYLNLHDKFDFLTTNILEYTKNRTEAVQQNWTWIWIPFLIIDFLLIFGCYQFYKSYMQIYENFLNLFKYAETIWINRDMERYKILINILNKNSDVMFKYQFDLEQKEKYMMAERYKLENQGLHESKKKKSYKDYHQIPTLIGLICLSALFSVFFVSSLIIQMQTNDYLDRYTNTADIYKYIGDLCFQIPGLFSQRQFLYWWFLYYPNDNDKPRMTTRLFDGIESCRKFDTTMQYFNQETYLTTETFVDSLNNLTQKPVCNFFNQTIQEDYSFYCNRSYEGALTMGITQALIYIANSFTTLYELNNFTSIVKYYKYEAEGMYIIVKGLIELVSLLKEALLQATSSHMDQIIGLSVFLLVFQILIFLLQFFILHRYYTHEYQLVRRFMLLLPSSTVLLDDNFERNIRVFYTQYQI
ncbi:unnamed protein product (macronuclear) [Paramecium tetraurelia]|uniref:Transmembrane protein n=1 Tax=Paramecium tetraurelia TaxID=5888 RepID=A0BZS2_PARTE|nr:uncharacterized protein GSPATT00005891001 [Paramecium tetraurelia]CAK64039.1 unnamed protein product [Paramecium tetraurelia]|eukprot:XP_001431437.1 hypothetical protein (macronuclear) [Paramecium tetraurelia strain d4-2]